MLSPKTIKVIGYVSTGLGFAATALGNWADQKQMETVINKEVTRQVAELLININKNAAKRG